MKKNVLIAVLLLFFISMQGLLAQNINKPNIPGPAGLSVNSFSGGLFYQRSDLMIPCRGPFINLIFYYNSGTTAIDWGYGPGWSFTYSMKIIAEGNKATVWRVDCRKDDFHFNGTGYNAPTGNFDTLVEFLPGKFRLTLKTGTSYYFENTTHHRLTKITDKNNNQLTIAYTDSLPTTITDPAGRFVTLNYTDGHLTEITDPNTSPVRHITYVYDPAGNPVTVTDALGNSIHYAYDFVKNITILTDQTGNLFHVSYANCATVQSLLSSLDSMFFEYDTSLLKTTITEPVNGNDQSTSYRFDSAGNLQEKAGNCCGYHQVYRYDSNSNMIQRTDAAGGNYFYQYDLKGNVTNVMDPLGISFATSYTTDGFNQVAGKTDALGTTTYSYDVNGNLVQVVKPLGFIEQFTYDGFGNMVTYTDGRGYTTQYQYNTHGDLTRETFPDSAVVTYTYDNVGNRLSFTNARGNTTTYVYDLRNNLKMITDALGYEKYHTYDTRDNLLGTSTSLGLYTNYSYDALNRKVGRYTPEGTSSWYYDEKGNVVLSQDKKGINTYYSYNTQNLLASETNAEAFSRSFTYDANGNKMTETDFTGNLKTYAYDAGNRLVQITDALSQVTTFDYDDNGNQTSVTDANGHLTSFVYDAQNRLVQMNRPIGTTDYVYDAVDNKVSVSDPNGHATTYLYDTRNRPTEVTDALGNSILNGFDLQGNLVTVTDRNGNPTMYTYDVLEQKTAVTNPAGETITMTYDAVGKILTRTLPSGNVITNTYDFAGRLAASSDLVGTIRSYTYDENSNILSETDGNGNTTSYTYDALNRIGNITDPAGNGQIYSFNNDAKLISEQDRNGNMTTYTYDALQRKTNTLYPAGNQLWETYDAVGNILSRIDNINTTTYFSYDAGDRLISETFPNSSTKLYTYDAAGNMISRTDNAGHLTQYTYDALNRLTTRDYPGTNDDSFTYDNESRVLTAVNSNATLTYTYDVAGRVASAEINGKTTLYTYDLPNNKRTITYPGGRIIEESFDNRLRLIQLKDNGIASIESFTYDVADRMLTRLPGNNTSTGYSYDINDRTTNVSHTIYPDTISNFNYFFDNEGNRLYEQKTLHPVHSEGFTYDANERLSDFRVGTMVDGSIGAPTSQTQYNFDGSGNRTTVMKDAVTTTYTSNILNQYTIINSGSNIWPTYDLNGNVYFDGTHSYTSYDNENRLLAVDGGATATYKYDSWGRRIQKTTSSVILNYYYDGDRIIEERDNADSVLATYVFGTSVDDIVSMRRNYTDYYYHLNSLGSVAAITDNTGAVVERYEYDAYGKPAIYDGVYTPRSATAVGNPYMFTGREYDAETGNYHYRARFYNPDWGRFGQRDPFEQSFGTSQLGNPYLFVNNNPVNQTDSRGMDKDTDKLVEWAKNKIKELAEKEAERNRLEKAAEEAAEKAKEKLIEKCKEKVVDAIGATGSATVGIIIDYTKFELETAQAIINAGGKIANTKNACLLCAKDREKHYNTGKSWSPGTIDIWSWNVWRFGYNKYTVICIVKNGQCYATVPSANGSDIWIPCW